MDRDEIEEYVHRCQQRIESSPQMDEENTKVKLVQPYNVSAKPPRWFPQRRSARKPEPKKE